MLELVERGSEGTDIPIFSSDLSHFRDALSDDEPGVWRGETTLPMLISDQSVRLAAPTAYEIVVDPLPLIIDTALARHFLLRHSAPEKGTSFQWLVGLLRASRAVPPEVVEEPEVRAAKRIDHLIEATALSQEKLGEVVGVTRGTIHNWKTKGRVSGAADAERLLALDKGVSRLRQSFGRATVGNWLLAGDPSPASLLRADISEFDAAVERLVAPSRQGPTAEEAEEAPDFSSLAAFLTAPASSPSSVVVSDWQPTEDLGSGSFDYLDEEDEE